MKVNTDIRISDMEKEWYSRAECPVRIIKTTCIQGEIKYSRKTDQKKKQL
jgi:hypothetical protein